ncbi:MAG: LysR family transcriptional regulator [Lautropia sp.]
MLDLDQVATFVAVVDSGSFGGAAGCRGISQGAVSQQVGKLESRLGARLLVRSSRQCTATPAGAEFLPHARALLGLASRAERSVRLRSAVFGASSNIGVYLLQPYLREFARRPGAAPVQVRIGSNPEIADLLDAGQIDAAAMEWWDGRPGYHALEWRREALVAIAAPDHPWALLRAVSRARLEQVPLLGGESGTGTGRILAQCWGGTTLRAGEQLGSTEAVKQWVKAGLGVSVVLSGTVASDVADGSLRAIPFAGCRPVKALQVIWRGDLPSTSAARQFVDHLVAGTAGR